MKPLPPRVSALKFTPPNLNTAAATIHSVASAGTVIDWLSLILLFWICVIDPVRDGAAIYPPLIVNVPLA